MPMFECLGILMGYRIEVPVLCSTCCAYWCAADGRIALLTLFRKTKQHDQRQIDRTVRRRNYASVSTGLAVRGERPERISRDRVRTRFRGRRAGKRGSSCVPARGGGRSPRSSIPGV